MESWKWKVGVFPSFLVLRPKHGLNCLGDQASCTDTGSKAHDYFSQVWRKRLLLWYSISGDKCFQKKSTGYSEVQILYTIKLRLCLALEYFSPDHDTSLRSCFPAPSSFPTLYDKDSDAPMKILHLPQSPRSYFLLMWKRKGPFQKNKEHIVTSLLYLDTQDFLLLLFFSPPSHMG